MQCNLNAMVKGKLCSNASGRNRYYVVYVTTASLVDNIHFMLVPNMCHKNWDFIILINSHWQQFYPCVLCCVVLVPFAQDSTLSAPKNKGAHLVLLESFFNTLLSTLINEDHH
jgi:hypothetical protein